MLCYQGIMKGITALLRRLREVVPNFEGGNGIRLYRCLKSNSLREELFGQPSRPQGR